MAMPKTMFVTDRRDQPDFVGKAPTTFYMPCHQITSHNVNFLTAGTPTEPNSICPFISARTSNHSESTEASADHRFIGESPLMFVNSDWHCFLTLFLNLLLIHPALTHYSHIPPLLLHVNHFLNASPAAWSVP
jgi:hypothetical protein